MIRQLESIRNGEQPPVHEGPAHLSPSSIKLYLGCSLRYYFKKVLDLPEAASPSLHLGKAVHAGLQAFHRGRWRGESHDLQTVLQAYEKALAAQENDEPVEFKPGEREKLTESGKRVLGAYLESGHAGVDETPLGVEVQLEEDFAELPLPLLGYIDLVRAGNVPVDFKTCASTPDRELEAFNHDLQLTAYQLLIERATGEAVEARELVFLVKTKTPKVIVHRVPPATESDKARFWAMAHAAVDGIGSGRFHPQPGMHCSWCSFREQCRSWKGGAG